MKPLFYFLSFPLLLLLSLNFCNSNLYSKEKDCVSFFYKFSMGPGIPFTNVNSLQNFFKKTSFNCALGLNSFGLISDNTAFNLHTKINDLGHKFIDVLSKITQSSALRSESVKNEADIVGSILGYATMPIIYYSPYYNSAFKTYLDGVIDLLSDSSLNEFIKSTITNHKNNHDHNTYVKTNRILIKKEIAHLLSLDGLNDRRGIKNDNRSEDNISTVIAKKLINDLIAKLQKDNISKHICIGANKKFTDWSNFYTLEMLILDAVKYISAIENKNHVGTNLINSLKQPSENNIKLYDITFSF
ncbi:MAG: hypothetical protein HQK49_09910 [Oligoflexia bacterium]|nr:hypothetical protein [Oligoflexia bacterium]